MAKYDALSTRAATQITSKGGAGVLVRSALTIDEIAQTKTAVDTSYAFKAVADQISKRSHGASAQMGSLVGRNLQYLIVSGSGLIEPMVGDKVVWAGFDWRVVWYSKIDPAGDGAILYDIFIER